MVWDIDDDTYEESEYTTEPFDFQDVLPVDRDRDADRTMPESALDAAEAEAAVRRSEAESAVDRRKKRTMTQRNTKVRPRTAKELLVVSETPYRMKDTGYADELLIPEVAGNLCQGDVNKYFASRAYADGTQLEDYWLWTIRTQPRFDNTLTGFAIAKTQRFKDVLVLHLEVICSVRGQGKQLFQNILRWCKDPPANLGGPPYPNHRYFELEAVDVMVFNAYKAWIKELAPEVTIYEYLTGRSSKDVEERRLCMEGFDNGTSDARAYTPKVEELKVLDTRDLRKIVKMKNINDDEMKTKDALVNAILEQLPPILKADELKLIRLEDLRAMARRRNIDPRGGAEVLANRLSYQYPDCGLIPLHIDLDELRGYTV